MKYYVWINRGSSIALSYAMAGNNITCIAQKEDGEYFPTFESEDRIIIYKDAPINSCTIVLKALGSNSFQKIIEVANGANYDCLPQYVKDIIISDNLSYFEISEDNYTQILNDMLSIVNSLINKGISKSHPIKNDIFYRPYITAIKSKPFLLLAGISGTGKSRIVRELARSCWEEGSDEYNAQKPQNFEMIQVKPNWHDSSELIGYVSRITSNEEYVVGDFLRFIAKAWENWLSEDKMPYFLCLDEMNLAPVEQYFAEYLSVLESRKIDTNGCVVYDPIIKKETEGFDSLTRKLAWEKQESNDLLDKDGICLPPNLIVVGTVNMDETTFSFSRKVLDRAMTIEMNDVDLHGGLLNKYENIGKLGTEELIGSAVEAVDVYESYKNECDVVLEYLQSVNDVLNNTPFKIAYRTRNEFLLYVVNNLPYSKDSEGNDIPKGVVIARALDEITSMKILSRIEGDDTKVSKNLLDTLSNTISDGLNAIVGEGNTYESKVSLPKLEEMKERLNSGYTSFWS